ncbi:MAG: DUF4349 domain-containing protein [Nitrosarchaeum sp.]|nr:DUF4349 domain-containing protein [Nitrosarchaeum sp.]
MNNGAIALLGGLGLLAVGVSVKKKIQYLENQIRLLNSRISSLINERDELTKILRNKDSEIAEKNTEISKKNQEIENLKDQLKSREK